VAGDPPPLLVVPLEPIGSTGHATRPGRGRAPQTAPGLDELEAELFAVAWFIAAGDDRLAAHAVRDATAAHHRIATGVADPASQARQLLVRGAVRLARRAPVTPTGDRILDLVFLASARARAAVVLCEGLGLDEPAAGQLLGVDRWACASYRRHALGHGRFVGVPEAVAGRFTAEHERARRDGVPVRRPLRFHERHGVELRRVAAVAAAVAVIATWRSTGDPPPAPPSPFLLLDAPGWTLTSAGVADPATVRAVRVHRAAPTGEAIPPSLVVYGPAGVTAPPPAPTTPAAPGGAAEATAVPTTTGVAETVVSPGAERNGWQTFVVQSASCGRTFATAHGLDRVEVVASLRTTSCTARGDIRLAPPSGTGDELVREPGAATTTARYLRGTDTVTVTAWVSDAGPDAPAGPRAVRIDRDGRQLVAEAPAFGSGAQVRVRVGGMLAVVQAPDTVPVDTLVDLAVRLRPVDERAWRAAVPPPTTTAPPTSTTAAPSAATGSRWYVTGPLPDGHRIASSSLATATVPWWRTLGPLSPLGGSSVLEARVEPAAAVHDVEGPQRPLLVGGRVGRIVVVEDARVPGRPDTDAAVALHAELRDGDVVLHVDAEGVTEDDLEVFLRGATIGTDAASWSTFVEASRQR
jgi:hypothetical protein